MRRICYVQYTNPAAYPPLEHSSRILAREGWGVLFLGTGDSIGSILRFPPHPNIEIRQISFCPGGWRQKLHYLWFWFWAAGKVLFRRPQWIYVSDSLSCPIGFLFSFLPGLKVIYHEHDSPTSGEQPTIHNFFPRRFILWTRKRLGRRAQLCILPNEQRTRRFAVETGRKENVVTVWNCPSQEEIGPPRSVPRRDVLWVCYHGSLVPARLPLEVLLALTRLPEAVGLRVVGYETVGHKGYLNKFREEALKLRVAHRVEFVGVLPTRKDIFEYCQRGDVGLTLMPKDSSDPNDCSMAGASNKPFDYLACGLALLVSDLPDWKKMYVEPGYAKACDPEDPQSIAAAFRWFLDHPAQMREMGEAGRQRVLKEWNYEQQFALVLKMLHGKNGG